MDIRVFSVSSVRILTPRFPDSLGLLPRSSFLVSSTLSLSQVGPLLQLARSLAILGRFKGEGSAAVARSILLLRPFGCDVAGLEAWVDAAESDDTYDEGISLGDIYWGGG